MLLAAASEEEEPLLIWFQWAPTLGGECYYDRVEQFGDWAVCFNGHPPLGVNATGLLVLFRQAYYLVSMGTHPWG